MECLRFKDYFWFCIWCWAFAPILTLSVHFSMVTLHKPCTKHARKRRKNFQKSNCSQNNIYSTCILIGLCRFCACFFVMQSLLAQLEYYRMAMQRGHLPARRISLVATTIFFSFACWLPAYHNYAMANVGVWIMLYYLLIRKTPGNAFVLVFSSWTFIHMHT